MTNSELTRRLEACDKSRADVIKAFIDNGMKCTSSQLSKAMTFPQTSYERFISTHTNVIVSDWMKSKEEEIYDKVITLVPADAYVQLGLDDENILITNGDVIYGVYDSKLERFKPNERILGL